MLLDFSTCQVLTGWTSVDPGANADITIDSSSDIVAIKTWKSDGTYGNGFNNLGVYRTAFQAGASAQVIYWTGKTISCSDSMWPLNKSAQINYDTQAGIYLEGPTTVTVWNGSGGGVSTGQTWANDTWYDFRAVINANGTVTFSYRLSALTPFDTASPAWTSLASSTVGGSGNYTSNNVYMSINTYASTDNMLKGQYLAFFAYTTNGSLAPTAPSGLGASAVSSTSIDLSWTDNGTAVGEDTIHIERSLSSGSGFSEIDTVAQGVVSYSDTGLDPETTYYYRIRGSVTTTGQFGATYNSGYSSEATAETESEDTDDPGEDMLVLGEL